jgi:hypothetical protein
LPKNDEASDAVRILLLTMPPEIVAVWIVEEVVQLAVFSTVAEKLPFTALPFWESVMVIGPVLAHASPSPNGER